MRHLASRLLLTLALLALTACPTLEFRRVQADFNAAVQADNAVSVSAGPLTDPAPLYDAVIADLADATIESLDPKLHANAYLIRGMAQWRRGDVAAQASARAGRKALDASDLAGSRDDVLLAMLPGLSVHDARIDAWSSAGETVDAATFETAYAPDFATAWAAFDDAAGRIGPRTPPGVVAFLAYQRWRLAANWNIVIGSLPDDAARRDARAVALGKLGASEDSLSAAVKRLAAGVPEGHPLRTLIHLQTD